MNDTVEADNLSKQAHIYYPTTWYLGGWDRRWQIASGIVAATCTAAAIPTGPGGAGAVGTACYAGTASLLGAKEASVVKSHFEPLGGDGDWGALGRDTIFNGVTTACSAIPGFGPTCGVLFTLDPDMAGPHWDE